MSDSGQPAPYDLRNSSERDAPFGFDAMRRGRLGLAVSFWVWGVLGSALLDLVLTPLVWSARGTEVFALVNAAGTGGAIYYAAAVMNGVWLSGRRYSGPLGWVALSRIAVCLGLGLTIIGALSMGM